MATKSNKLIPVRAIHPGEILREELRERGIKQKEFAQSMDMSLSYINRFINGKRNLTEGLAIKLENILGIPRISWVNLQKDYAYDIKAIKMRAMKEHSHARFSQSPILYMGA